VSVAALDAAHRAARLAAIRDAHSHAEITDGDAAPTLAAWALAAGLSIEALRHARRAHQELAALPTRGRGAPPGRSTAAATAARHGAAARRAKRRARAR
jgi:hypothetical protein